MSNKHYIGTVLQTRMKKLGLTTHDISHEIWTSRKQKIAVKRLENDHGELTFVDIRRYYKDEDGDMQPSNLGVRVKAHHIKQLIELLNKAVR